MSPGGLPRIVPSSTSAAPSAFLEPAGAILRQYGEQFRAPGRARQPRSPKPLPSAYRRWQWQQQVGLIRSGFLHRISARPEPLIDFIGTN
jgi:hypothetical protein